MKAQICISIADNAAVKCPKVLSFDVNLLFADTMLGLTKVTLNLTVHSSALSFTVIMACQCHLKITLCHHFDATGELIICLAQLALTLL